MRAFLFIKAVLSSRLVSAVIKYDQEKLNSLQLRTEKETIVFVSVQNRDEYKVQGFLNNPSKQLIWQTNDYRFYLVHVRPDQP